MTTVNPPGRTGMKISKRCLHAVTHVNIGFQIIFPLTLSFTPLMVARAETEQKKYFLRSGVATQTYILKPGETVTLIAERHHSSLAELKQINQHRISTKKFESLTSGDEIDVPINNINDNNNENETRVAQQLYQSGSFLQNNPNRDSLKDFSRSQAVGAVNAQANQKVSDWLGAKGKARVSLDVDRNFSLKNSQIDLLLPLWEDNFHQVFTQGAVHHTDSRNQSNLGVGYRYFKDGWMLGANTFFDHDWSRNHSRLGLGSEYQRDYLKVGANAYVRLTNWKDSPDFENYEERPANGWDIRAEGYLPAYPGIGAKLVYEQYYGDSVALFGKDNRQKNPGAVTTNINYSPFPLAKFSVDHRMGKGNQNDTRFGVDINYVFGVPLERQIDREELALSRSLAANRYDFVDRNNNIVLEYRKKSTITLKLAPQVSGYSGEVKSLGVSVNSSNGVERIDWSAPELFSQGGQIVQVSPMQYNVLIPEYHYGAGIGNSYVVSGVAYDKSGNASTRAESLIVVTSAAVSAMNSTLTPMEINLPNDASSSAVLTLTLRDANGHLIAGVADDISVSVTQASRSGSNATVTSFVEDANQPGVYNATVNAGENIGIYQITPEVQNVKISPVTLNVGSSPIISNLILSGTLAVGEKLSGSYQFDANKGNTKDTSLYQWGDQGKTGGLNQAVAVTVSGSVPSYTLTENDAGQVKELSVQARNGMDTRGNILTITTAQTGGGNNTEGGGEGGVIVDETAAPSISNVAMSGKLAVGEALSGSYTFAANTGNPTDTSEYQWGEEGTTASIVGSGSGKAISQSGVVPSYTIQASDTGNVLEVSVLAKNSAGLTGNTITVNTAQAGGGNNTEGGVDGQVVEPYKFTVNPSSRTVGETLQYQYSLTATATANGKKVNVPNSDITWSSSNNDVATINSSGLVTAKAEGSAVITAKGTYNSQSFNVQSDLDVAPLVYSPLYGVTIGGNASVMVTPPNYSVDMQCGEIVDGMGSIGGSGGDKKTINNTDNVTKITTTTGLWYAKQVVGKIVFTYKDGSTKTCGSATGVSNKVEGVYTIPNNYRLQGYKAYGKEVVNGVQYVVVLK